MRYEVVLKPRAVKEANALSRPERQRILERIAALADGLRGDVKRLTNLTPEYRLRVGDYRVLFEVEGTQVVVYRIKHRREAYRQ
jgi:mRNA interferase RelE/StbE